MFGLLPPLWLKCCVTGVGQYLQSCKGAKRPQYDRSFGSWDTASTVTENLVIKCPDTQLEFADLFESLNALLLSCSCGQSQCCCSSASTFTIMHLCIHRQLLAPRWGPRQKISPELAGRGV